MVRALPENPVSHFRFLYAALAVAALAGCYGNQGDICQQTATDCNSPLVCCRRFSDGLPLEQRRGTCEMATACTVATVDAGTRDLGIRDLGVDAPSDAGVDAGLDAAADADVDAGADDAGTVDAGDAATADAGNDAATDAGTDDAGGDAGDVDLGP